MPVAEELDLDQLKKQLGLSRSDIRQFLGKIAWRRRMQKSFRGEFAEKYPEDSVSMFLTMGRAYFDTEILIARKKELVGFKPYRRYHDGQAVFFHPRVVGRRYIIGADPASGREVSSTDTDNAAAVVLDMESGEEMAGYRAKVTPEDFAYDLADLGRYYNNAPIAVERTGDGGTTILVLGGDCKYPAIAKFKEWHRKQKKVIEVEGFPTNVRTRPIALNFVNRWILDTPELIWDENFLNEALVFVRNEKGIPSGNAGAHDDTVSARWIAHGMRQHALGYWTPGDGRKEGYINAANLAAEA